MQHPVDMVCKVCT